jgi:hypothetical protein
MNGLGGRRHATQAALAGLPVAGLVAALLPLAPARPAFADTVAFSQRFPVTITPPVDNPCTVGVETIPLTGETHLNGHVTTNADGSKTVTFFHNNTTLQGRVVLEPVGAPASPVGTRYTNIEQTRERTMTFPAGQKIELFTYEILVSQGVSNKPLGDNFAVRVSFSVDTSGVVQDLPEVRTECRGTGKNAYP